MSEGLIGLGALDILADHGHGDLGLWVFDGVDHRLPLVQIGVRARQAQALDDDGIESLAVEDERDAVDDRELHADREIGAQAKFDEDTRPETVPDLRAPTRRRDVVSNPGVGLVNGSGVARAVCPVYIPQKSQRARAARSP